MYDIKANLKRNLLLLRLEGPLSDRELKDGVDLCISEAKKLKKGFTIINDISKMKPASQQGANEIVRAQSYVVHHGVGIIIRIVKNATLKEQFKCTSDKAGYTAIEASSLEEAYELVSFS